MSEPRSALWRSAWRTVILIVSRCLEKGAPVVEHDVRQPDLGRRHIEAPHSAVVVLVPRQPKVVPLLRYAHVRYEYDTKQKCLTRVLKAKFNYAVLIEDRSEAGRRPVAYLLARVSSK